MLGNIVVWYIKVCCDTVCLCRTGGILCKILVMLGDIVVMCRDNCVFIVSIAHSIAEMKVNYEEKI